MRRLSLWQVLNSPLNGFQEDPVGGMVGLEKGSEKGFQWAGFGGCGGGLVGVEVPPPPSLEDPTDTSFSSTAQLNQTDQWICTVSQSSMAM